MTEAVRRRARAVAGELLVPVLMLICVAAYWLDAAGLSAEATSFPFALTIVLAVALAAIVVTAILSARREDAAQPSELGAESTQRFDVKTWIIVILPIPLVFLWHELGAIVVFLVYTGCLLYVLGERRPVWLVGLPAFLAFGLVYLFKVGLYVRLPDVPSFFAG